MKWLLLGADEKKLANFDLDLEFISRLSTFIISITFALYILFLPFMVIMVIVAVV